METALPSPDVSVIIGAYNIADYIEAAIHSALAQTGVTLEVIVVDDCSADDTLARARAINDPRLTVIAQTTNGGPSVTRSTGFALARGSWIAVLDGDDLFLPGRLARCLAHTANTDIIVDNLTVYREADATTAPMFDAADLRALPTLQLTDFIAHNCRFLGGHTFGYMKPIFSAAFLKKHALVYRPELRIGEDYLLMAEALACGARCVVEPTEGYRYTVRTGSISHRISAGDVAAITAADRAFAATYPLSPAARRLTHYRMRKLREALAFSELLVALKARNPVAAIKAIVPCPSAAFQLWRPLVACLERLTGRA